MTVNASDINTSVEALLDRTQFLYQRAYARSKYHYLLPWNVFEYTPTTPGILAGFNGGILDKTDIHWPNSPFTASTTLGAVGLFPFQICPSTAASIYGTGAVTNVYIFCDFYGSVASVVDTVQLWASSASDVVIKSNTKVAARSDVFTDGDTPPHYSTHFWVAERWAGSGNQGNLHYVEYNESSSPAWSASSAVSPFGGVGDEDQYWAHFDNGGLFAHYTATAGQDGTLVAVGQPIAAGSWYVNTSTDLGQTWGGRSALSVDSSAKPILLQYSEALAGWVLVDDLGHIWLCTGSPATGSNWVKQDAEAAGDTAIPALSPYTPVTFNKAVLVYKTLIATAANGSSEWVLFTDDFWATHHAELGWDGVHKVGDWVGYTCENAGTYYLGVSHPVFDEQYATDRYTP